MYSTIEEIKERFREVFTGKAKCANGPVCYYRASAGGDWVPENAAFACAVGCLLSDEAVEGQNGYIHGLLAGSPKAAKEMAALPLTVDELAQLQEEHDNWEETDGDLAEVLIRKLEEITS